MRMVSSFLVNFEYVLKSDVVDFTKLANVTQRSKEKDSQYSAAHIMHHSTLNAPAVQVGARPSAAGEASITQ